VDLRKVPPGGVNARCSVCFELIPIDGRAPTAEPSPVGTAAPSPSPVETAGAVEKGAASASAGATVAEPAPAGPAETVAEPAPAEPPETAPTVPLDGGIVPPSVRPTEAPGPEAEPAPPTPHEGPGAETPVVEPQLAPEDRVQPPVRGVPVAEPPGVTPPPVDVPGPAPHTEEAAEEGGLGGGAGADVSEAPSPSRPRFGQRDPSERARRLARALVSDMIAYHPERHRQALERGDLAEEFDEEIRRSWEEYVEQVGEELSQTTTYFQEALNEILAEGRDIF
jgi:hypothetical protein